jgi:hypothetical protein
MTAEWENALRRWAEAGLLPAATGGDRAAAIALNRRHGRGSGTDG